MMISLCAPLFAFLTIFPSQPPADGAALLSAGDAAFERIDYPTAVSAYEQALTESPDEPDLLWRLARVQVCAAEVEGSSEKRLSILKRAEEYARKCIGLDPRSSAGHTWLAAVLGYLALETGAKEQIVLSRELLSETDRALELDPANDAAFSIRGSFFRALGNVGWLKKQLARLFVGEIPDGGFEEAETALRKAVALAPDIMRHYYELGVLYVDMDRVSEACDAFEHASRLPVRVAIDRPRLAKIRGYLKELNCRSGVGG